MFAHIHNMWCSGVLPEQWWQYFFIQIINFILSNWAAPQSSMYTAATSNFNPLVRKYTLWGITLFCGLYAALITLTLSKNPAEDYIISALCLTLQPSVAPCCSHTGRVPGSCNPTSFWPCLQSHIKWHIAETLWSVPISRAPQGMSPVWVCLPILPVACLALSPKPSPISPTTTTHSVRPACIVP